MDNEKVMVTIPIGTTVIETSTYEAIRDRNAMMSNTFSILKARILNEWITCCKKGYSSSLRCAELADILGIKLPEVEREVLDD